MRLLSRAFAGRISLSLPSPSLIDSSASGPVAGNVSFVFPDGAFIDASQQQLPHPLPYSGVGIVADNVPEKWASGTQVAVIDDSDFLQIIMVTKTGLMTQITVRGVPLRGIAIPVTKADLLSAARQLDVLIASG